MLTHLSILIVSYNTRELTLACLRSTYAHMERSFAEVIVVDNASSDGSGEAIAKEFPQVRLIRSLQNLGFARANNVAAREATGEFILLLNPDTVVLDGAINRLMAFAASQPDAGIWGGRTVFADGSLNPTSCWRFMSVWSLFSQATGLRALFSRSGIFNPEGYAGWLRDSVREVEIVTGCFLLTRRDLWERLGGFDERFFMYAEEADLCYRARRFGARPLFTPDATIVHYGGASEAVRSNKIVSLLSAKITFLQKHWPKRRRSLGVSLLILSVLTRVVGYSLLCRLPGFRSRRALAEEWHQVWALRKSWINGYRPR